MNKKEVLGVLNRVYDPDYVILSNDSHSFGLSRGIVHWAVPDFTCFLSEA